MQILEILRFEETNILKVFNYNIVSFNINGKITFYTVIKIVFLLAFSIFQIMMLMSIFSSVKVVSKIEVGRASERKSENSEFL
jgi:hypothetical protein